MKSFNSVKAECRFLFTDHRFPFTECRTVKAEWKDFPTGFESA